MKKLLAALLLITISTVALAGTITTLLLNTSTVGAGTGVNYASFTPTVQQPNRWFQATLNGASAVSATVEVDGSTDNVNWVPILTITLPNSVTGAMTDGGATVQTAPYIRGKLVAISGVGETVTLIGGE
jgi:hypothetical protein